MLDQSEEKWAVMRKDVLIKERQDSINDELVFISNIIVYSRFWVKIDKDDINEMTYIIQMLIKIADFLSISSFTTTQYQKLIVISLYTVGLNYIDD